MIAGIPARRSIRTCDICARADRSRRHARLALDAEAEAEAAQVVDFVVRAESAAELEALLERGEISPVVC